MSLDKFNIAWNRIKRDRKSDFIIGDFEYTVYDSYSDELLVKILERYSREKDNYIPEELRIIRVPKEFHTSRPGTVPEIDDRIVFQYLIDELADQIESNLIPIEQGVVHSYRYVGDREAPEMFRPVHDAFPAFRDKNDDACATHNYLVITDISAYFERIYRSELRDLIEGLGASRELVISIFNLLKKLQKGSPFGIPQGIWPSDYIGNIYLDPVDKYMIRAGYNYFRYMDDIRVGADDYLEAQKILLILEEQLYKYGLNLNAKKTRILLSNEVDDYLNPYKRRYEEIFADVAQDTTFFDILYGDPAEHTEEITLNTIEQLFLEELSVELPDKRIMKYCLNHFRSCADADVLQEVMENMNKLVVVTPQVVNYLVSISEVGDFEMEIVEHVSSYIEGEESCYEWQLMWLLQCLDRIGTVNPESLASIRLLLMRIERIHKAVAVNAILLLGKHGDHEQQAFLMELYDRTQSQWVRRAILFAMERIPRSRRNSFYGNARGHDVLTDKVVDYVKSKEESPPLF